MFQAREAPQAPVPIPAPQTPPAPGTSVPPPPPPWYQDRSALNSVVAVTVLLPLVLAIAWRLIRRTTPSPRAADLAALNERMQRIESGVEAIAIEIERVSEGQRFLVKSFEGVRLPAPGEKLPAPRKE